MEKRYRNLAKDHVDAESECLYRYVRSETEKFGAHCHDYYEIFLTLSDGLTHMVNGKKIKLAEGTLVFIRDFDFHNYSCKKSCSFINIAFSKDTLNSMIEFLQISIDNLLKSGLPPAVILDEKERERLLTAMSELNTVNFNDKKMLKTRFRILLTDIFSKYFMHINADIKNDIPYWLERCCEKMKQPANFIAGTERMFEIAQKSREHTARSLQKYYGVTPSEFVNNLRINYAANMLINSNLSVTDICYECGFGNLSWFYSLFKDEYGVSPKKFRLNIS